MVIIIQFWHSKVFLQKQSLTGVLQSIRFGNFIGKVRGNSRDGVLSYKKYRLDLY